MAKTRSYEEIQNINDVDGPMSSTSIHGAVVTLSPVKKGRKAIFLMVCWQMKAPKFDWWGFRECSNES